MNENFRWSPAVGNLEGHYMPTDDLLLKVKQNPEQYPDALKDFQEISGRSESEVRSWINEVDADRTGFGTGFNKAVFRAGENVLQTGVDVYNSLTGQASDIDAGKEIPRMTDDQNIFPYDGEADEVVGELAGGVTAELLALNPLLKGAKLAPKGLKALSVLAGEGVIAGATSDSDYTLANLADELGVTPEWLESTVAAFKANPEDPAIIGRLQNAGLTVATVGALGAIFSGAPKVVRKFLKKNGETAEGIAEDAAVSTAQSKTKDAGAPTPDSVSRIDNLESFVQDAIDGKKKKPTEGPKRTRGDIAVETAGKRVEAVNERQAKFDKITDELEEANRAVEEAQETVDNLKATLPDEVINPPKRSEKYGPNLTRLQRAEIKLRVAQAKLEELQRNVPEEVAAANAKTDGTDATVQGDVDTAAIEATTIRNMQRNVEEAKKGNVPVPEYVQRGDPQPVKVMNEDTGLKGDEIAGDVVEDVDMRPYEKIPEEVKKIANVLFQQAVNTIKNAVDGPDSMAAFETLVDPQMKQRITGLIWDAYDATMAGDIEGINKAFQTIHDMPDMHPAVKLTTIRTVSDRLMAVSENAYDAWRTDLVKNSKYSESTDAILARHVEFATGFVHLAALSRVAGSQASVVLRSAGKHLDDLAIEADHTEEFLGLLEVTSDDVLETLDDINITSAEETVVALRKAKGEKVKAAAKEASETQKAKKKTRKEGRKRTPEEIQKLQEARDARKAAKDAERAEAKAVRDHEKAVARAEKAVAAAEARKQKAAEAEKLAAENKAKKAEADAQRDVYKKAQQAAKAAQKEAASLLKKAEAARVALEKANKTAKDAVDKAKLQIRTEDLNNMLKGDNSKLSNFQLGLKDAMLLNIDPSIMIDYARQMAKELEGVPSIEAPKGERAQNLQKATLMEVIAAFAKELYITNILSGVKTISVNLVGTLINVGLRPGQKTLGHAWAWDLPAARQSLTEYMGYRYAFSEALKAAGKSLWRGKGIMEDFDHRQLNEIDTKFTLRVRGDQPVLDMMRRIWNFTVNLQTGTDEFYKQMMYRGRRYGRALAEAERQGLTGARKDDFIFDYVEAGFDADGRALNALDLADAKEGVFQKPWDPKYRRTGLGRAVGSAIDKVEKTRMGNDVRGVVSTVFVPFSRTPTNIVSQQFDYVAFWNLIGKNKHTKAIFGDATPEEVALSRGRYLSGMAGMAIMYQLYNQGDVDFTGRPSDVFKLARQEWENLPAYTIIAGDYRIPMAQFAPYTAPMMALASIVTTNYWAAEADRTIPNEVTAGLDEHFFSMAAAAITTIGQMPALTGIQSVVQAAEGIAGAAGGDEGSAAKLAKTGTRLLSGFNPLNRSIVKDFDRWLQENPVVEDARDWKEVFWRDIPGNLLPGVKRDALGRVRKHEKFWDNPLSLLRIEDKELTPGADLVRHLSKNSAVKKSFLLDSAKQVITHNEALREVDANGKIIKHKKTAATTQKVQGSLDLSKMTIGDTNETWWDRYQEYVYDHEYGYTYKEDGSRVENKNPDELRSSVTAIVDGKRVKYDFDKRIRGETYGDSVERLATEEWFKNLNPVLQADIIGDIMKPQKAYAKKLLHADKTFLNHPMYKERLKFDQKFKHFLPRNITSTPNPLANRGSGNALDQAKDNLIQDNTNN